MRSKFEKRIANELRAKGAKFKYEEYSFEYFDKAFTSKTRCAACGSNEVYTSRWYTPDFFLQNGIIVETKGKWTGRDRRKMLAVREAHPSEDIRMCFMYDNKLSKNSTTRYSDWCKANDFPYSVGSIPDKWLEDWVDE